MSLDSPDSTPCSCPWGPTESPSGLYNVFVPSIGTSLDWRFEFIIRFSDASDNRYYTHSKNAEDYTANGISFYDTIDFFPWLEGEKLRQLDFMMPPQAILKGIELNNGSYNNIPITVKVKGNYQGESTEITVDMRVTLTKTSLVIEPTSRYGAIFIGVIGGMKLDPSTYTSTTAFSTLPDFESPKISVLRPGPVGNDNQLYVRLDIDESVKNMLVEGHVLPIYAVDSSNIGHYCLVTQAGSEPIEVLFNYPVPETTSTISLYALKNFVEETQQYNKIATISVGKGNLSDQTIILNNLNDIRAADFVETTDDKILLQKGGRVWCKEFIESTNDDIQLKKDYSVVANEFVEV